MGRTIKLLDFTGKCHISLSGKTINVIIWTDCSPPTAPGVVMVTQAAFSSTACAEDMKTLWDVKSDLTNLEHPRSSKCSRRCGAMTIVAYRFLTDMLQIMGGNQSLVL